MASSKPVRAVVFDLDGLMVDTEPFFEVAAERLLALRGHTLHHDVIRHMLGTPARQGFAHFREYYQLRESIPELIAEATERFFEAIGETPVPLMPGIRELLDQLDDRRIPRAIGTSSGRAYVERVLKPHGLLARFSFAITSDDVSLGKPFPEVYQKTAAGLGVDPEDTVVLEDSLNGLKAAKAAGARCILVPHALVACQDVSAADLVVSSLEDPQVRSFLGVI